MINIISSPFSIKIFVPLHAEKNEPTINKPNIINIITKYSSGGIRIAIVIEGVSHKVIPSPAIEVGPQPGRRPSP